MMLLRKTVKEMLNVLLLLNFLRGLFKKLFCSLTSSHDIMSKPIANKELFALDLEHK